MMTGIYKLVIVLVTTGISIRGLKCQPNDQYLIFSGLNNGGLEFGVFTGVLNLSTSRTNSEDLYLAGQTCLEYSDTSSSQIIRPIDPVSFSYDLMDNLLTLRVNAISADSEEDLITIGSGPLCPGKSHCEIPPHAFLWNTYSPMGTLGPFVVYSSKMYYLLQHSPALNNTDYRDKQVIELYVMEDCESMFPKKDTSIELTHCSRSLAVVLNETYSQDTQYIMGKQMTRVETAQGRVFLFVLFKISNFSSNSSTSQTVNSCTNSTTVQLYSAYDGGHIELLNETVLMKCWTATDITTTQGLGGVSYYPDEICWSVIEGVWCARWDSQTFSDVVEVLDADEVVEICSAVGITESGGNSGDVMVTGILIHQSLHSTVPSDLSLYFGCQMKSLLDTGSLGAQGGSGWLWMSYDRSNSSVSSLLSGGKPVWAGSLQFAQTLSRNCETDGNNPNNPGGGTYPQYVLWIVIAALSICHYVVYDI